MNDYEDNINNPIERQLEIARLFGDIATEALNAQANLTSTVVEEEDLEYAYTKAGEIEARLDKLDEALRALLDDVESDESDDEFDDPDDDDLYDIEDEEDSER
ncbi:hypothetical protein [Bifidobacterium callitrichidarum]|uniref:Uncharacterized protein n=1 Tax=Bifidobacterium callitrichidarum TaxID=2052941 RepID=A0A2U2NCL1_9BIFI|nr:hypothetical protein [Bifidobacterium callitrichidarum]PWG66739.1 hypothetical protein DF196_02215 [Bifidobacterium callitrichidarum]